MKPFLVRSEKRGHETAEERNHCYFRVKRRRGSERGRAELAKAGRVTLGEVRGGWAEGAPPPVRYQSTAASSIQDRITAHGLASQGGRLPTSAPAQRRPISPPSAANRRGDSAALPVASGRARERRRAPAPIARAVGGAGDSSPAPCTHVVGGGVREILAPPGPAPFFRASFLKKEKNYGKGPFLV